MVKIKQHSLLITDREECRLNIKEFEEHGKVAALWRQVSMYVPTFLQTEGYIHSESIDFFGVISRESFAIDKIELPLHERSKSLTFSTVF